MLAAIKSIPATFYSKDFYAGLILRGKGIGMGLIPVLFIIGTIGPLLALLPALPEARTKIMSVFERMPDIDIKNGKMTIDRASPYAVDVKFDDDESFVLMFDMNREVGNLAGLEREMKKKNINILATSEYIVMRKDGNNDGLEVRDYSEIDKEGVQVHHDQWLNIGDKIATYFPLIFVVILIPLFIATFIGTFSKALVVKFFALFSKTKPDISAAMRLAAAAGIPVATLELVLALIRMLKIEGSLHGPGFWLGMLLWAAFAIFGLVCASKEAKPA